MFYDVHLTELVKDTKLVSSEYGTDHFWYFENSPSPKDIPTDCRWRDKSPVDCPTMFLGEHLVSCFPLHNWYWVEEKDSRNSISHCLATTLCSSATHCVGSNRDWPHCKVTVKYTVRAVLLILKDWRKPQIVWIYGSYQSQERIVEGI